MDAGIKLFIKSYYHEDKADLLLESLQIFEDLEVQEYVNDINDLIAQESNIDRSELPSKIEQIILTLLNKFVLLHGIKLQENTPIDVINQLCIGLNSIEYYLDIDSVIRTLESDIDNEEKLSQLLSFTTLLDENITLVYLEEVSSSLLDKISISFNNKVFESLDILEFKSLENSVMLKVKSIERFLSSDLSSDLIGVKLVKAGILVGASFDEYKKYIFPTIEEMTVEQAARELFLLLSISKDGNKSPLEVYSKNSELLFHNIDKITKVYSQLSKLILEFDRYELQRSYLKPTINKVELK